MKSFKHFLGISIELLFIGWVALYPSLAGADTIAIIGTGQVASALGPRFASAGNTIIYGSREPGSDRVRQLVRLFG